MTNRIAIGIGLIVAGALLVDYIRQDSEGLIFLARKGAELIEWMAFWR
ncbi:hypothetical protein [Roseovarius spongiae]|nr:hypothetical protein [Roseovarius spongiae]